MPAAGEVALPGLVAAMLTAFVGAQEPTFDLLLRSGERVLGARIASSGGEVVVRGGGRELRLPLDALLAIQGTAVQTSSLPHALLAGGEVLRGTVVGGDAAGDACDMMSPVFGRIRIATDRIDCLLLRPEAAAASELRLPAKVGEALFTKAGVGLDVIAGSLHQFAERGILFQPDGRDKPAWFRTSELVGLRVADAVPRKAPACLELVTRAGDRLGIADPVFAGGRLRCTLEDGTARELAIGDVAALTAIDGVAWLSAQEPQRVVENSFAGAVLLPWRRDVAVTGDPLCVAGRTHGRGFGVHSRSRLTFRVPAGAATFRTLVGIDASCAGLAPQADVDVRISIGDRVLFEQQGLRLVHGAVDVGALAVAPDDELTLEVDFGRGRDLADRVDWLSPVFLPSPAARQ
jgi:hypothetical protein